MALIRIIAPQRRAHRLDPLLLAVAAAVAAAGLCLAAKPAAAGSCSDDIEKLAKRRMAMVAEINRISQAGKGKLDPVAACPKLRNLAAVEAEFATYLTNNKDWCGVPDDALKNITSSHSKTVKVAAQACNIAAQIRKAQQHPQQAGEAPFGQPHTEHLTAGPL